MNMLILLKLITVLCFHTCSRNYIYEITSIRVHQVLVYLAISVKRILFFVECAKYCTFWLCTLWILPCINQIIVSMHDRNQKYWTLHCTTLPNLWCTIGLPIKLARRPFLSCADLFLSQFLHKCLKACRHCAKSPQSQMPFRQTQRQLRQIPLRQRE